LLPIDEGLLRGMTGGVNRGRARALRPQQRADRAVIIDGIDHRAVSSRGFEEKIPYPGENKMAIILIRRSGKTGLKIVNGK
jgi:hypothetical protein